MSPQTDNQGNPILPGPEDSQAVLQPRGQGQETGGAGESSPGMEVPQEPSESGAGKGQEGAEGQGSQIS